jgi:hypothetical protein
MTQDDSQYEALHKALIEGEKSGDAGILDMEAIRQEAKQKKVLVKYCS